MSWQMERVVFRLRSPMHVGRYKAGNLQLTYPYVTGRVLWGALTARITRDDQQGKGPATENALYEGVGELVHEHLAFTYFYPALQREDDYEVRWPWQNEAHFRARFLGSYASTALTYPRHSAEEGSLHEVELLSPMTIGPDPADSERVFLLGYIFTRTDAPSWASALTRLQLGGERGYGWGRVTPVADVPQTSECFGYSVDLEADRPEVTVPEGEALLAHTPALGMDARGEVEPLVGRLWSERGAGQQIDATGGVCYVPSSTVESETRFAIDRYGLWERID